MLASGSRSRQGVRNFFAPLGTNVEQAREKQSAGTTTKLSHWLISICAIFRRIVTEFWRLSKSSANLLAALDTGVKVVLDMKHGSNTLHATFPGLQSALNRSTFPLQTSRRRALIPSSLPLFIRPDYGAHLSETCFPYG